MADVFDERRETDARFGSSFPQRIAASAASVVTSLSRPTAVATVLKAQAMRVLPNGEL
jgi:hypothetical protein